MPTFIPGLELSRQYYQSVVGPLIEEQFADLSYAAALLGPGSDVLGFDTPMSTDHGWGPRVLIFLPDSATARAEHPRDALVRRLPETFQGYSTCGAFVDRGIRIDTLRAFAWRHLAYDLDQPLTAADWLTFPSAALLELTAGAVFYDPVGELSALRQSLAYYPHDVWLYLLAAGWQRIGQEEHLMPRAGSVGDELGAGLIGARLVRDMMSLCFLMERRYAPYPKWFGTAFGQLGCASDLRPMLWAAQRAETWQMREAGLSRAYEYLARMHNALAITDPLPEEVSGFHNRPFQVIGGEAFAEAICRRIGSEEVKRIAARRLIGSIDQFSDSTDLRSWPLWRPILRQLYP